MLVQNQRTGYLSSAVFLCPLCPLCPSVPSVPLSLCPSVPLSLCPLSHRRRMASLRLNGAPASRLDCAARTRSAPCGSRASTRPAPRSPDRGEKKGGGSRGGDRPASFTALLGDPLSAIFSRLPSSARFSRWQTTGSNRSLLQLSRDTKAGCGTKEKRPLSPEKAAEALGRARAAHRGLEAEAPSPDKMAGDTPLAPSFTSFKRFSILCPRFRRHRI